VLNRRKTPPPPPIAVVLSVTLSRFQENKKERKMMTEKYNKNDTSKNYDKRL
jgi:hypothetical protein